MSEDASVPDDETLRQLQTILLRSVLLGEPLPGSNRPPSFPDLGFLLRQPAVLLSSENLADPISVDDLPKPLRVLTPEALAAEPREQGEVAYLRFQPAKQEADTVHLALEARLAAADPEQRLFGLSGIQVAFRPSGEGWTVVSSPASYAL